MSAEQIPERRSQFGRRELLVVVGVAALVFAAIIPVIRDAREDANRTECMNNLKQIGLGVQNYHDIRQEISPSYLTDDHSPSAVPRGFATWAVLLAPFQESRSLYVLIDVSIPLDEPGPPMEVIRMWRPIRGPDTVAPPGERIRRPKKRPTARFVSAIMATLP